MIKPLHPTLKACKCGFIGTKPQFYKHMDSMVKDYNSARQFFLEHGEAVLNFDDPRIPPTPQVQITRRELIDSL